MHVSALRPDVLVVRSARWQTTCTILHAGDETFIVDSPVYPSELDGLPNLLTHAGWELSGLLVTHGDWDHLLARYAFPAASVGAAESTVLRLRGPDGQAARNALATFDRQAYIERSGPLDWGEMQPLPVPGHVGLGGGELELHPAEGHTSDGVAILAPQQGVLCCGDYISPCEIPTIAADGDLASYSGTLERLIALIERVDWVVPGHGEPLPMLRALAIAREDRTYIEGLSGPDPGAAPLPLARRGEVMEQLHRANVERVAVSR